MAAAGPHTPEPAFRLFGALTASAPGSTRLVDLGSPKQRTVLAVLLLHRGRVVSSDRLVEAVWGDHAPPAAIASLQAYISNLRRALRDQRGGPSPIVRRSPGYVLDIPAEELDLTVVVEQARQARQAIAEQRWTDALDAAGTVQALAGAPLLEDLADEPWVVAEREQVREVLAEAGEARAAALMAIGRSADATEQTMALHAGHPLRDRTCWLHMVALHQAGRSPEALEAYRAHARLLDVELGLEPSAELRELQVAILRQDPALAAWPRTPGWTNADVAGPPESDDEIVTTTGRAEPIVDDLDPFVGREREVAALSRLRDAVAGGHGGWCTLTGPAGIGKTRLAAELARGIEADGGTALWTRCSEESGAPAWWPIRQLARALGLEPNALLQLAPGADADAGRFAIYEAVASALAEAATHRPILIVVDDVHWADGTSARCLAHLVGALQGAAIAVVLTLRDGEDLTAIEPLLGALAREGSHRALVVPPLEALAVRTLADGIAETPLDPGDAERLAARTGGNPLFVREYARLAPTERAGGGLPLAVRSVLGRRLRGLDPALLTALQVAAVLDDMQDLALLAALTDRTPDAVADVLDEAADERIVVAAPGTGEYAFAHGLLRDEIVEGIPTMRRRRLHLRAAQALAERGAASSRVAGHLVQAMPLADPAQTLDACERAAREAAEHHGADDAARWWGEAVAVFDRAPAEVGEATDRDTLLVEQVKALARAGRGQALLDAVDGGLLQAVRQGRTAAAGRLAASVLRVSGSWPWVAWGDFGPLLERLEAIQPLLEGDPGALARVLAVTASGNAYHPDPAVPERQSRRAIELAEAQGDPDILADALLGRIITYAGVPDRLEESLVLIDRLQALDHANRAVDTAVGHSVASMATMTLGDVPATMAHVREAVAAAELLRLPVLRVQLRWMQVLLAHWNGDLREARAQAEIAKRVHLQTELHSTEAIELVDLVLDREAGTVAPDAVIDTPLEPLTWDAILAAERGDLQLAEATIGRWCAERGPFVWTTLSCAVMLADVAAEYGLRAHARTLIATMEPHRDRIGIFGQVAVAGVVALALARLHHLLGEDEQAEALLVLAQRTAHEGGGTIAALRCRLFAQELGLSDDATRRDRLAQLAADCERIGLERAARMVRTQLG